MQSDTIPHNAEQFDVVQCNVMRRQTVLCNARLCSNILFNANNAKRHNMMQHKQNSTDGSLTQFSATQYNTIHL